MHDDPRRLDHDDDVFVDVEDFKAYPAFRFRLGARPRSRSNDDSFAAAQARVRSSARAFYRDSPAIDPALKLRSRDPRSDSNETIQAGAARFGWHHEFDRLLSDHQSFDLM
jgi:hypothetical protein